ncbi:MAG TPA: DUF5695 domain-containing protein [Candidatus Acidoferrum sp.]|nr:DUF5695 domain-containing protein [Candidatus Acidoferrum sp.]
MRPVPILFLSFLLLVTPYAQCQSLSNSDFRIDYSPSGLSHLKHVRDKYDTDYIAAGRRLGDVLLRYRATGAKDWQKASAATLDSAGSPQPDKVSFTIGELVPTTASSARASASVTSPALQALNDRVLPQSSHDPEIPRFAWFRRKGTLEWVQYDFAEPKQVKSVQLYWAIQEDDQNPWKLPKSWRVLYRDGDSWKEVTPLTSYALAADREDDVTFSPVTTSALRIEVQLQDGATAGIYEWRINDEGREVKPTRDLQTREDFQLRDNGLIWTIFLKNNSSRELEIGDLALPLPFNTQYVWDKTETYTKRLIPHFLIAGNGSFLFWMRTNTEGPYLVMTPVGNSKLEYFEPQGFGRGVAYFIHSAASGEELRAKGGTWRLPHTRLVLASQGQPGDGAVYQFKFRWAQDYASVRGVLYEEGAFDINVVPGMTIPSDLMSMFSVRTHNKISDVTAEHPQQTRIEYLGERAKDTYVYRVHFSHLGENLLKLRYANDAYLALEFFVTEPLETMFKKRSSFLVTHEQYRDPGKFYNSVFSQWDMKHQALRSPDDLDGLQSYAVASDDPALGKAPYVAGKNIFFPEQSEIDAAERYLKNFVWGGLQQTDKEPYPFAIYGIPNWKVNRDSAKNDDSGKKHIWRIYDYPHVILLYYNMYRLAKLYPSMTHYLDADGYLERAFGTAKAFFTVPLEIVKWSAYETGTYNELVIPDLIDALYENGRKDQAGWLKAAWEKKIKYFINDHPYLFGSEYPFDSTGFESTHAFAKYAMRHVRKPDESLSSDVPSDDFRLAVKYDDAASFLEEQMKLNLACRGWLETAYYYLGSDYRGSGPSSYTLSYMAQMGGWAVSDYALYYARDPIPYLRLGYASYLSSWALLNSGTPESDYGYWYPGKNNDGGAGGGFEPRPWGRAWLGNKEMGRGSWWYSGEIDLGFDGALRSAATIVSEDPIFGLFAYGGDLEHAGNLTKVVPKDGLRARFHIVRGAQRVHILLDRDGFAKDQPISFDDALATIRFTLENRADAKHETVIYVSGLPAGAYEVKVQSHVTQKLTIQNGEEQQLRLPVDVSGTQVDIARVGAPNPSK